MSDDGQQLKAVLYIEDDNDNFLLVQRVLERKGHYRVIRATDGEQGLSVMKRESPEVVLLDLDVPLLDGLSLARLARQDEKLRHIPLLAISASVMNDERKLALEAGCKAFIAKPFDIDELEKMVDECVARPKG